ncbi:hypothetical protein [Streptomyces sp. NPDC086989]|uniref:hypothetical protein n=1 Tax=Streptomyces sp. NPDC086989 TaxID=3365764 RepID=UPI00380AF005
MPPSPRIAAAAAAVLLATLLCGGCSARASAGPQGSDPSPSPSAPPSSGARPAPLQQIGDALGCTPEITVDAEELREGACGTGPQAFRMATFTSEQGRQAWLTEAQNYGGTYLVGPTWVVTGASAEALAPAHTRLGGTIQSAPGHGSSHDAPPGPGQTPAQDPTHDASHGSSHAGGHDSPSPAAS